VYAKTGNHAADTKAHRAREQLHPSKGEDDTVKHACGLTALALDD
jgi:hypothetical protein